MSDSPEFTDRAVTVRGLELRVLDSGPDGDPSARTFVLVHGLGVSSLYYRELAEALSPHGRVIAVDLPGFGRTDKPGRALRMSHFAMVVEDTLEDLGLGDAVLIGHSMGTQVVVETLARRPGIASSAVLIGPVVNERERRVPLLVWRFLQSVLAETPASVAPSILAWLRCGPRMLLDTVPPMVDYRLEDRLAEVDVPVVLLAGAKDRLAPRTWLDRLARAAGGTALVEVVADASHQVMVTHPERVTAAILGLARRDDG
ncbi:alpha/beta hydrolase [Tessaracoccus terricola]